MAKGKVREEKRNFVTGFAQVEIKAVNPDRSELNRLLGKEDSEEDTEPVYVGKDKEGNDQIRLEFWMQDDKSKKLFSHKVFLTRKDKESKTGKTQFVNCTCGTCYADSEEVLPAWFKEFQDKEKKKVGDKRYRKALDGEEQLVTLVRGWLGRMDWYDVDCDVLLDTNRIVNGELKELRELINSAFDSPFVALIGVKTNATDPDKKYQDVYGKAFLPNGFMKFINNGFKFPSDYSKKIWDKFEEEVNGEYGFKSHFELGPLTDYDESKDLNGAKETKPQTQPQNSDY